MSKRHSPRRGVAAIAPSTRPETILLQAILLASFSLARISLAQEDGRLFSARDARAVTPSVGGGLTGPDLKNVYAAGPPASGKDREWLIRFIQGPAGDDPKRGTRMP